MARALRPTTIIPQDLYVERAADRQLDRIIDEMGRPGYVLVARQMGKTNMLINMKRTRERRGDLVCYFDLSTRFDDARALFRFVIDSLLEGDEDLAIKLAETINGQRESQPPSPNLEYDRHLRMILRATPGRRIIIVLDEIDSLISVAYSDVFFAQIRSMYFSRVNYPDYHNLTYVLSGVAEPTDLIKDKHISPFNIGEKIYLEDFSFLEFSDLLEKAKLNFTDAVRDAIYGWTCGNPRMTWDISADLEDIEQSGRAVTVADVNAVVEKLYLTRFDRAPVDHIRVLAESDPQIRSAIISIRWGKGSALDDRSKSRLYLAGISGGADGAAPSVKNRIIDAALSDAWLTQVAANQKTLLELAADSFQHEQYAKVIQLVEDHVRQQPTGYSLDVPTKLRLGMAQFYDQRYDQSIVNLKELLAPGVLQKEAQATCNYFIGCAFVAKRDFGDSIPFLQEAASYEGRFRLPAKLILTSAYLNLGAREHSQTIASVVDSMLKEIKEKIEGGIAEDEDAQLAASAYFNLSQTQRALGENEAAENLIEQALAIAPKEMHPALLLRPTRLGISKDAAADLAEAASEIIMREALSLSHVGLSSLAFSEAVLALGLLRLHEAGREEQFSRLLTYAVETLYAHARRPFDVLLHLLRSSPTERGMLAPLLWTALERYLDDAVTAEHRLEAFRFAVQLSSPQQRNESLDKYFDALRVHMSAGGSAAVDDLMSILTVTFELASRREYSISLKAIDLGRSAVLASPSEYWLIGVILLWQEMQIYLSLRQFDRAREAARTLLVESDLDHPNRVEGDELEVGTTIATYRQAARRVLDDPSTDPLRKIGRNEKITVRNNDTGRSMVVKFKLAEEHIRSGKYSLISRDAN